MVDVNFQKAVDAKKIADIRDFLRMRLTLDHNCVSGLFIECRKYCLTHGITELDLYQTFDGRPLPNANTKENFTKLLGQLSTNFAKKRIERLLEIGQAVWPEEQGGAQPTQQSTPQQSSTQQPTTQREEPTQSIASTQPTAEWRIISETSILDRSHSGSTHSSGQHSTSGANRQYKGNGTRSSHNSGSTMNTTALIAGVAVTVIIVIVAIAFGCSK